MFTKDVWKDLGKVLAASGSCSRLALPGVLRVFKKLFASATSLATACASNVTAAASARPSSPRITPAPGSEAGTETHVHEPGISRLGKNLKQVAQKYLEARLRDQLRQCNCPDADDDSFIKSVIELLIQKVDVETVAGILLDPYSLRSVFLRQFKLVS